MAGTGQGRKHMICESSRHNGHLTVYLDKSVLLLYKINKADKVPTVSV